jgi:hypothetical protein
MALVQIDSSMLAQVAGGESRLAWLRPYVDDDSLVGRIGARVGGMQSAFSHWAHTSQAEPVRAVRALASMWPS